MEGANEEIRELSYTNAKKLYGDDLPQIVIDASRKELDSIVVMAFQLSISYHNG